MEKTIVKGVAVLEHLCASRDPVRLTALAKALDLTKSNAHRLVSTLTSLGFVTQEAETGRYLPTLKVWELGSSVIARHPVRRMATPYLQELHRLTGDTVTLTVLAGDEVMYLDRITARRPVRGIAQPGSRAPAPLTASGKAILAHEPAALDIADRLRAHDTRARALDLDTFALDLQTIRKRGYAVDDSGWLEGVISIAAPLIGKDGRAAAAITISSMAERLVPEKRGAHVDALMAVTSRLIQDAGPL